MKKWAWSEGGAFRINAPFPPNYIIIKNSNEPKVNKFCAAVIKLLDQFMDLDLHYRWLCR